MGYLSRTIRSIKQFAVLHYDNLANAFEGRTTDRTLPESRIDPKKKRARWAYNAMFALGTAILIVLPAPKEKNPPTLRPGDISNQEIVSPITAEIEPNNSKSNADKEAARLVAPIFDYDDTAISVWLSNWEQTFRTIRKEYYLTKIEPPEATDAYWETLSKRIQELTGQTLNPTELAYLHENRFSYSVQRTFSKVASRLMGRLLSVRDLFPSYYSTGIVVREVNRSLQEVLVNDVSRIWSLDHAREFLGHYPLTVPLPEKERVSQIVSIVGRVLVPNLTFNNEQTQQRIAIALGNVQARAIQVHKGQVIIRKGERITQESATLIETIKTLTSFKNRAAQTGIYFIAFLFFFGGVFRLSIGRHGFWHKSLKDALVFVGLTWLTLIAVKCSLPFIQQFFEPFNLRYGIEYLLPVTAGPLIVYLTIGRETAVYFSIVVSLLLGILLDYHFFFSLWAFTTSMSAIKSIRTCKQRTDLYRCGVWSGFVGSILVMAYVLLLAQGHQEIDWVGVGASGCLAFLSGLLSAIVTNSLIPIFESALAYTTSLKLLELSNFNHPLLHSLMIKAPGTYHHSVIVGSLAEVAADSVRANGLLARVSAYYHDIGKMSKPLYFIENQSDENPHDAIGPKVSAKILFSHVKNGAKLGRDYGLGNDIISIIEQHHGTTLIAYFFNKAKKGCEHDHSSLSEDDFRYPGPLPQSREAAIVMLADACEAATRSIGEPTPAKIESMVHNIINRRFLEQQFNECDLTFSDLRIIEKVFVKTLVSLYHHRVEYPGQHKAENAPTSQTPGQIDAALKKAESP